MVVFAFFADGWIKNTLTLWFLQNFMARKRTLFSIQFFFLFLCIHLFVPVYVPLCLSKAHCFVNPLAGTVEAERWRLVETHCGFNIHIPPVFWQHISQEGSKVVLEFLLSPFDIKEWSLRWQNTQDSMGWINTTLKVIPGVRHCFSTKRQKQRDNSTGCLYWMADSSHAHQEQERLPVWNVYTANIK